MHTPAGRPGLLTSPTVRINKLTSKSMPQTIRAAESAGDQDPDIRKWHLESSGPNKCSAKAIRYGESSDEETKEGDEMKWTRGEKGWVIAPSPRTPGQAIMLRRTEELGATESTVADLRELFSRPPTSPGSVLPGTVGRGNIARPKERELLPEASPPAAVAARASTPPGTASDHHWVGDQAPQSRTLNFEAGGEETGSPVRRISAVSTPSTGSQEGAVIIAETLELTLQPSPREASTPSTPRQRTTRRSQLSQTSSGAAETVINIGAGAGIAAVEDDSSDRTSLYESREREDSDEERRPATPPRAASIPNRRGRDWGDALSQSPRKQFSYALSGIIALNFIYWISISIGLGKALEDSYLALNACNAYDAAAAQSTLAMGTCSTGVLFDTMCSHLTAVGCDATEQIIASSNAAAANYIQENQASATNKALTQGFITGIVLTIAMSALASIPIAQRYRGNRIQIENNISKKSMIHLSTFFALIGAVLGAAIGAGAGALIANNQSAITGDIANKYGVSSDDAINNFLGKNQAHYILSGLGIGAAIMAIGSIISHLPRIIQTAEIATGESPENMAMYGGDFTETTALPVIPETPAGAMSQNAHNSEARVATPLHENARTASASTSPDVFDRVYGQL